MGRGGTSGALLGRSWLPQGFQTARLTPHPLLLAQSSSQWCPSPIPPSHPALTPSLLLQVRHAHVRHRATSRGRSDLFTLARPVSSRAPRRSDETAALDRLRQWPPQRLKPQPRRPPPAASLAPRVHVAHPIPRLRLAVDGPTLRQRILGAEFASAVADFENGSFDEMFSGVFVGASSETRLQMWADQAAKDNQVREAPCTASPRLILWPPTTARTPTYVPGPHPWPLTGSCSADGPERRRLPQLSVDDRSALTAARHTRRYAHRRHRIELSTRVLRSTMRLVGTHLIQNSQI